MRRIIIIALLALTGLGGVASADRDWRHRGDSGRSGGVHVQRSYPRSNYRNNNYRYNRYNNGYRYNNRARVVVRPRVHVVRRPIYVQRPVIAYRYYNYAQRPALIAENYPARPGYFWVPGQWQWNGYEWIWRQGHYQPDPAYDPYQQYDSYTQPTYTQPYSDPYYQY